MISEGFRLKIIEAQRRLLSIRRVRLGEFNQVGFSHPTDKGFMADKRCTTIDILALVVTFLGFGVMLPKIRSSGQIVFSLNERSDDFVVHLFEFGIAYCFPIKPFDVGTQSQIGSLNTLGKFLSSEGLLLRKAVINHIIIGTVKLDFKRCQ